MRTLIPRFSFWFASCCALLVGCSSDEVGSNAALLTPACTNELAEHSRQWHCPDPLTVECVGGAADVDTIFVVAERLDLNTCDDVTVSLDDEGPFYLGTHEIVVNVRSDGEENTECAATLTVVDEDAPSAEPQELELWPPNHKMHTISIEDCVVVEDACDQDLDVHFVAASSDEPVNDVGDGNSEPDIILGCDEIELRAERQGPGDGRVYTLHWEASDDAGHGIQGSCTVLVPHDQSGRPAVDSGAAYQVETTDCAPDGDDDENLDD